MWSGASSSSDVNMTSSGSAPAGVGNAKIVSKFSEEFDINKIMEAHDKELMEGLEDVDEMDFVQMNSSTVEKKDGTKVLDYLTKQGDDDDEEDDEMEGEEDTGAAMNAQMEDAEDFDFGEEE